MTVAAPAPDGTVRPEPATPAMRLQMMSTEHWSLLASRNLAWTEVFARASMFLSALSFSVVALALAGQASGFGEEFRIFALIVLPVVLFLVVLLPFILLLLYVPIIGILPLALRIIDGIDIARIGGVE